MKPILVANWKNHPSTLKEAKKLFEVTKRALESAKRIQMIIAPPAIFLRDIKALNKSARVSVAAQAAHWDIAGAHTGEITLSEVKDSGAKYVLVGHAERRARGETNDDVRREVAQALSIGLTPILCVGESKRDSSGEFFLAIRDQVREAFRDVPVQKTSDVVVAYEPLWAIGAVEPMTPVEMHVMSIYIRKVLHDDRGKSAMNIRILYGGAIDEKSALRMLAMGDVQGLLVGRSSSDPIRVVKLLESLAAVK